MRLAIAASLLLAPLCAYAAAEKTRVAVMDIQAPSLSSDMREAVTALVPQVLEALGPFKAITGQDIRQMLALESMKDRLGCNDVTCLAEIGGALGADLMVSGRVVLAGDTYLVQLELTNVRRARVESRVAREYRGGQSGLVDEMRVAVKLLVRDVLAARSGRLAPNVSEEGATIRLDGAIVGSSPMPPFNAAAGMHSIAVEKDGFIRFLKDVEVVESKDTAIKVTLIPSDEHRRRYEASARTHRWLAWGGFGVSAAAFGGAAALWAVAAGRAESLNSDVAAYNANAVRTNVEAGALTSRRSDIGRLNSYSIGLGGVGLAALVAGAVLLATGDNPDRYGTMSVGVAAAAPAGGLRLGGYGVCWSW